MAIAAGLAQSGAEVTLVARSEAELESAADAIRAEGGHAEAAVLDVGDLAAVEHFFSSRPAFKILVNNAGTNRPMPMQAVASTDYDAVMNGE